jgi:hypothetical protein
MAIRQKDWFYIIKTQNTTTTRILNLTTNLIESELPTCPDYKFGVTNNIKERIKYLEKDYHVINTKIIYLKKYKNSYEIENYIKDYIREFVYYDKFHNQKEWFGETESYKGDICSLNEILEQVNFYNQEYKKEIIPDSKTIISAELKELFVYL